jgi:isoquinoline 1-oxidoreductase beta subunit
MRAAARTLEAEYRVPFLAHATLEPQNCTAWLRNGTLEIWAPTQVPSLVPWIAGKAAGVDSDRVVVHTTLLGGGFGRRGELDMVAQAAWLARHAGGRPLQFVWSREEDMQHDMYRPAAVARLRAGFDASGRLVAQVSRVASGSVVHAMIRRLGLPAFGPDRTTAEGLSDRPYEFASQRVEHLLVESPVPIGFWRSVGHSHNAFFGECFLDEIAEAAGSDPYRFRRGLLAHHPRHLAVLDLAAARAGWGTPPPQGRAQGLALHESFGSIVAQVAEVSLTRETRVRVHRVVCAIDCGTPIHPDIIAQQMEGGVVFGLTAALHGEITLKAGRVEQGNFPDYEMLRLADAPIVETHIVPSTEPPGGVGEPGTPPIAPAVANAVHALTGTRIRTLPIRIA